MREEDQQECPKDSQSNGKKGAERIHQSRNAGEQWCGDSWGGDGRYQNVGQNVLVDKLWPDFSFFTMKGESYTGKHSIAIEPVSISAQRFIGDRIAAITDVLPAGEVYRYRSSVKTVN